jgi:hypothetical protein
MTSFISWVRTFSEQMQPVAIVDRVGGTVRPIYVAQDGPETSTAGPVKNKNWTPGEGTESPQMLYREMMNNAISPLLRSAGFKRKGQAFEKQRNGYNAYVGFQKNRWNTKYNVSFTINVSVVNSEVVEQQMQAWKGAMAVWGSEIILVPVCGQWGGRIGEFMGRGDYWWSFRSRAEMEDAAKSVVSALKEQVLPLMERELDKPIIFPTYLIETRGRPGDAYVTESGQVRWENVGGRQLWPVPTGVEPRETGPDGPDLNTPPHTWPFEEPPTVQPLPPRSTLANADITPFTAVSDGSERHALSEQQDVTLCGLSTARLRRLAAFFVLNHAESCQQCREAIEAGAPH